MTYNIVVHGVNGSLGWFFLQNFCLLRAIGYIIVKAATSASMVKVGSIIAQVALSSLFFGFFGLWHEWYVATKAFAISEIADHIFSSTSATRYKRPFLFGWKMQVILHVTVAASIGLVIPGSLSAIYDAPTPSNPKPGDSLVLAGISMFVVCWFGLCFLVVVLNKTSGKLNLETKVDIALIQARYAALIPDNIFSYFLPLPSAHLCLEFESCIPY